MRILGDILKELRSEKKITLEELSNELNNIYDISINKGMISKWEGNKSEPTFKYIKLFSEYYKVSVDYLLGLSERRNSQEIVYNKPTLIKENIISIKESKLVNIFNKLNETGKKEAIKRVSELTEINKYTTLSTPAEDKSHLIAIAAHDDNLTDDEKNIMDERINEALKAYK